MLPKQTNLPTKSTNRYTTLSCSVENCSTITRNIEAKAVKSAERHKRIDDARAQKENLVTMAARSRLHPNRAAKTKAATSSNPCPTHSAP